MRADTRMRDVIYEMSSKQLGMTCVVDRRRTTLLGIITDGDLRRQMERGGEILELTAGDVMTRDPVAVARDTLAAEALNIMEQRKITSIVVAEDGQPTRVAGVAAPARPVAHGDVLAMLGSVPVQCAMSSNAKPIERAA